jgi:hypothetical protein
LSKIVAIVRDEGTGKMLSRVGGWIKTRIIDSGDTIWLRKVVTEGDAAVDGSGYELRAAQSLAEHERLDRLRPLDPGIQKLRESVGGVRWFLLDSDGEVAFTCWTFAYRAIVVERPELTLPLPEHTWQVEDSYVPKAMRGAHGPTIGVELISKGLLETIDSAELRLLTKVDAENSLALKAAAHGRWQPFATVGATRWFSRFTRWNVEQAEPVFPALSELAAE